MKITKTTQIIILTALLASSLILPSCTTPPWAIEAEKIAKVALPILEGLTGILGGGPEVAQAENDISLVIDLFDKYQATPAAGTLQQIQAALSTVNADIAKILPATGIQNNSTQEKVAAVLQLVTSEFANIAMLIPSEGTPTTTSSSPKQAESSEPAAGKTAATKTPMSLSSKEFKAKYNKIVKDDPEFKQM